MVRTKARADDPGGEGGGHAVGILFAVISFAVQTAIGGSIVAAAP